LNQIINHLEVALDFNLNESAQSHVETSLKASKSLIYVINDLLDLTKVEYSAMLMNEEPFSMQGVILEVLGAFSAEAERKGLKILLNIDTAHLPEVIIGDSQRLRQAISNLLSNSLESSRSGTISIDIYPFKTSFGSESFLNITIRDEGEGMSEQQLDKIFQQFENILDEDVSNNDENTEMTALASIGLGLAVVARFVRNSGGQMRIKTREDVGTKVSLELPLRISAEILPKAPLLTPPSDSRKEMKGVELQGVKLIELHSSGIGHVHQSSTGTSSIENTPFSTADASSSSELNSYPFPNISAVDKVRLRILVAEDNPLNAKVLKMQLTRMGHEVTIVGDGQACLDKFKANSSYFDIILMDFQVRSASLTVSRQLTFC
jgi:CheY-like chemotaxis protein